ncbi:MAG: glycosyltransferase, partial [Candidatus Saccharimonadales bacterium]
MKKIVIDARKSGTGTGRYVDKLIEYLAKSKSDFEYTVLTKAEQVKFIKSIAPNFEVIETPYEDFSFGEQTGFKKQIESLKPDLVHFTMVQQPVLYNGNVVTTMHDLTTCRFKNPAKNPIVFTIKQQVYKWVNKKAARKSEVVIVPSEFVKNDVADYARINPEKIKVTYEAADKITEAAR